MPPSSHLFLSTAILLLFSITALAEDIEFDASAIENTNQISANNIDISQFNKNTQQSGSFFVTIQINEQPIGKASVKFIMDKTGKLIPDLTVAEMHHFGIFFKKDQVNNNDAYHLPGELSGISFSFNTSKLVLNINIPQAYLKAGPDEDLSVPANQWDEGIPALSLNYDINGAQKSESGGRFQNDDQYARLTSGVNIGAWRLRNTGTLDKPGEGASRWESNRVWLQRDIPSLRGLLSLGDNSSDASLFDGIDYNGLSLSTDTVMYSDKAQGYAPEIRGIARTSNALVEISQNGNVIDKRYVPAGQFLINDLYPQSSGGQLKVTITEADGSEHHFFQAWGMVPAMQRQGYLKYSMNAGQTRNNGAYNENFSQLAFFYGLPADMTLFGGTFITNSYHAFDLGYALGLAKLGSLSADVKTIRTHPYVGQDSQGQNYRFQYAKNVPDSNTDLSLSWSFSPTPDYISYPDLITEDMAENTDTTMFQRNQLQLSVNQPFGDIDTLVLSALRTAYWHNSAQESLSLSDNFSFKGSNISLGWAWTQDDENSSNQLFSINIQIPFSLFSHDTWISLASSLQKPGAPAQSIGLNGNFFDDESLNWELSATNGDSTNTTQDIDLDYKAGHGEYRTTYSHSSSQQSLSYQMKGSLVASKFGLTAGQAFNPNDAVALVRAPHAPGLNIESNTGVVTDYRGYTIVPFLQPYRRDNIEIENNADTDDSIDLGNTSLSRVPTEGAIVLAEFAPHIGQKILVTLKTRSGVSVPFGATATAGGTSNEGIVDENGNVYLTGAPTSGTIAAKWGNTGQECHASYQIQTQPRKHLYELSLVCQ